MSKRGVEEMLVDEGGPFRAEELDAQLAALDVDRAAVVSGAELHE